MVASAGSSKKKEAEKQTPNEKSVKILNGTKNVNADFNYGICFGILF